MKEIPSLLRLEEHRALQKITLSGAVLDIGGDSHSKYQKLIGGDHTVTVMNLDTKSKPDIFHDLEKVLPIEDKKYDHVMLINVLEHIYEYKQLLQESVRVLKPEGTLVIVVPFLFPVHPSPHDFRRFTEETLRKECEALGCTNISIDALGKGVFSAQYVLLDRLMPYPIRFLSYYTLRYKMYVLDWLFYRISKVLGKKYLPTDYALGYCVTARRHG
jgi:SAM-dependent methyltransferase